MKKKIGMLVLAGVMMLAAVGCGQKAQPGTAAATQDTKTEAATAAAGETAENADGADEAPTLQFEATTISGEAISSEMFADSKLTMMNVWATYCNPCLQEMPALGELAAEYDKADFQLIGVVSDVAAGSGEDALQVVKELVEKTGADYPHVLLNESLYYGFLENVQAVPTTFFIDSEGHLVDVVVGSMEKDAWKERIDGNLGSL